MDRPSERPTPADVAADARAEPLAGRWLVWGDAAPAPERFFDEEAANDDAVAWIGVHDPGWPGGPDGWAVVVSATPEEIDDWARAAGSVRGFAPYPPEDLAVHTRAVAEEHPKVERARPY